MKERPILMNDDMVRAILNGIKTQTRRPMKVQPNDMWTPRHYEEIHKKRNSEFVMCGGSPVVIGWGAVNSDGDEGYCSPFGVPLDRLWIRETWTPIPQHVCGRPASYDDPNNRYFGRLAWYFADNDRPTWGGKWRPSIHMPRWACRLVLEITDVRVERVQDISAEDAIAEGLTALTKDGGRTIKYGIPDIDGWPRAGGSKHGWTWDNFNADPRKAFERLWDCCYGPGAWERNDWVWVVGFKRLEDQSK